MLPILGWRNEFRWDLLVVGLFLFAVADTDYLFETAASLISCRHPARCLLADSVVTGGAGQLGTLVVGDTAPRRGLGSYAAPVACTVVALGVAVLATIHDSR